MYQLAQLRFGAAPVLTATQPKLLTATSLPVQLHEEMQATMYQLNAIRAELQGGMNLFNPGCESFYMNQNEQLVWCLRASDCLQSCREAGACSTRGAKLLPAVSLHTLVLCLPARLHSCRVAGTC